MVGKIMAPAVLAGLLALGVAATALAQGDGGTRFNKMDADGDGALSFDEFTSNSESRVERMDTNGDGAITKDEFVTFRGERAFERRGRAFERLDTNDDGEITRDEREQHQRTRFEKIDADGNGTLSREETRNARKRFAAAKRDRQQQDN